MQNSKSTQVPSETEKDEEEEEKQECSFQMQTLCPLTSISNLRDITSMPHVNNYTTVEFAYSNVSSKATNQYKCSYPWYALTVLSL